MAQNKGMSSNELLQSSDTNVCSKVDFVIYVDLEVEVFIIELESDSMSK